MGLYERAHIIRHFPRERLADPAGELVPVGGARRQRDARAGGRAPRGLLPAALLPQGMAMGRRLDQTPLSVFCMGNHAF